MKFSPYLLIPFIAINACSDSEEQSENTSADEVNQTIDSSIVIEDIGDLTIIDSTTLPKRMQDEANMILSWADGDLDKDGVSEKVVVYSRDLEWESSAPRDLVIYKQTDGEWEEWVNTDNTIGRADEGGMMGDPFGGIAIKNGILEINHSGGSSWKWGNTHKYRFQDGDFYLIGYTGVYGKPCLYWEDRDYNLSTGDCTFTFEAEECEEYAAEEDYGPKREESFNHKMKNLPTLIDMREYSYTFQSPNGEDFYL
ncbi:MAG: hypothetical protein BM555_00480 [Crocinitomix sp. MedPE-SWsnd]|nr:MAG: hypothetical protein BM555_00480 [Crocinitomix sp. MedPE-SWsnd]